MLRCFLRRLQRIQATTTPRSAAPPTWRCTVSVSQGVGVDRASTQELAPTPTPIAVELTELEEGAAVAVLEEDVLLMEAVDDAEARCEEDAAAKTGLALVELKSELRAQRGSAPSFYHRRRRR